MKLTLEHNGISVAISAQAETIDEVFDTLIKPGLKAIGYHEDTIAGYWAEC